MIPTALNTLERYASWTDLYIERILPGDYTCLVLAHCPNGYTFDFAEARKLDGSKIVILDFREYGWNTSFKNCDLAGYYLENQPMYSGEGWDLLHVWLRAQNIVAYFKREFSWILSTELELNPEFSPPFPIYPIDLISGRGGVQVEPVTKDEFMGRDGVMHVWGHSHEDRVDLEKALILEIDKEEVSILDGTWVENVHYSKRYPLSHVLGRQKRFLLSTALGGAGHKTFRHSESCVNCVPVVSDCGMRFSVPWTEENAVLLPTVDGRIDPQDSVRRIVEALQDKETLWQKYQAAQESARLLDQNVYLEKFVNPLIQAAL